MSHAGAKFAGHSRRGCEHLLKLFTVSPLATGTIHVLMDDCPFLRGSELAKLSQLVVCILPAVSRGHSCVNGRFHSENNCITIRSFNEHANMGFEVHANHYQKSTRFLIQSWCRTNRPPYQRHSRIHKMARVVTHSGDSSYLLG
jgi:hypothetical protein